MITKEELLQYIKSEVNVLGNDTIGIHGEITDYPDENELHIHSLIDDLVSDGVIKQDTSCPYSSENDASDFLAIVTLIRD